MPQQPTDIVILTHNRLDHLEAMVDALEQRTRAPFQITIVDNASGPEVRNWLQANRSRFHQLIPLEENLYPGSSGPALQIGIEATTSDPVVVTDPDLVVPDLGENCWLTQMLDMLERRPDFGILGIGLDQSNLPPVQEPENLSEEDILDGEIVLHPVGSILTFVRRTAMHSYYDDWRACESVARAGYKFGWALNIRAFHLGWDDYKLHPGHLASKRRYGGEYREVNMIERAPSLGELALAGPIVAETRAGGVADAAVLELAWTDTPAVGACVPSAVAVHKPAFSDLPFGDDAAGAVVLLDPPADQAAALVAEACRVAAARSSPWRRWPPSAASPPTRFRRPAGTAASRTARASCRCSSPRTPTPPSSRRRPSTTASAGSSCSRSAPSARATGACGSGSRPRPGRCRPKSCWIRPA